LLQEIKNNRPIYYVQNYTRSGHSYYATIIENHIWIIDTDLSADLWRSFRWPTYCFYFVCAADARSVSDSWVTCSH